MVVNLFVLKMEVSSTHLNDWSFVPIDSSVVGVFMCGMEVEEFWLALYG